jgi:hypothetical protein
VQGRGLYRAANAPEIIGAFSPGVSPVTTITFDVSTVRVAFPIDQHQPHSRESMKFDQPDLDKEEFFPRGAIAFFGLVIASYGLIWLAIYFLLIHRQSGL